ncbi:MAG: hypothetical protein ACN6I5_01000 [Hyphomicrobiales bacterium]
MPAACPTCSTICASATTWSSGRARALDAGADIVLAMCETLRHGRRCGTFCLDG